MSRAGQSIYSCPVIGCFWTLSVEIPWASYADSPPFMEMTPDLSALRAQAQDAERQCQEHMGAHTTREWVKTVAHLSARLQRVEHLLRQDLDAEHRARRVSGG